MERSHKLTGSQNVPWTQRTWISLGLLLVVFFWGITAPEKAWSSNMVWEIGDATLLSEGNATEGSQGLLLLGAEIKATATARSANVPIQEGLLTLNFGLFQPSEDMPGQKAGRWYLVGTWRLENATAPEAVRSVRHNPETLTGQLLADLDVNPLVEPSSFVALLRTSAYEAAKAAIGTGALILNEKFSGQMELNVKQGYEKGGVQ